MGGGGYHGGGPHLARRRLYRTHAFPKTRKKLLQNGAKTLALSLPMLQGWARSGADGPSSFEERPSLLDVFCTIFGFSQYPESSSLPHWATIDWASLFWHGWGPSALALGSGGRCLTFWLEGWDCRRMGIDCFRRRASVGGCMRALWCWSIETGMRVIVVDVEDLCWGVAIRLSRR